MWIAGTEDLEWGTLDTELVVECRGDVDLGEDTEGLFLQRDAHARLDVFEGLGDSGGEALHRHCVSSVAQLAREAAATPSSASITRRGLAPTLAATGRPSRNSAIVGIPWTP